MTKLREIIIVEGRYDKNVLLQIVDATVIETGGFAIFKDKKLRELLIRLAKERGVIILTDSDNAGFMIRNHICGFLPPETVKHAYIPDRHGKEKRKEKAGKEGKIGVEGMDKSVLLEALKNAGATDYACSRTPITKADFYRWGLSGGENSSLARAELKKKLDLPENMSANSMLKVLSALYGREEIESVI